MLEGFKVVVKFEVEERWRAALVTGFVLSGLSLESRTAAETELSEALRMVTKLVLTRGGRVGVVSGLVFAGVMLGRGAVTGSGLVWGLAMTLWWRVVEGCVVVMMGGTGVAVMSTPLRTEAAVVCRGLGRSVAVIGSEVTEDSTKVIGVEVRVVCALLVDALVVRYASVVMAGSESAFDARLVEVSDIVVVP